MTYARRVDANHTQIVKAIRACGGIVRDLSGVGGGIPDLMVACNGETVLVEIKDGKKSPSQRRLTPDQEKFHAEWAAKGGPLFIVTSEDEALAIFGVRKAA